MAHESPPFASPHHLPLAAQFEETPDLVRFTQSVRALCHLQQLPEAWCLTPAFTCNVERLWRSMNPDLRTLMARGFGLLSRPMLQRLVMMLSQHSAAIGQVQALVRMAMLPALDQPELVPALAEPSVLLDPDFKPAEPYEAVDLRDARFMRRFFWNHDDALALARVEALLKNLTPDVIAIGSGPSCSAALWQLGMKRPGMAALVLDVGDYYSQSEYEANSTLTNVMQSYKDLGIGVIVNGPGQVSVNLAPAVWGGGAEIFSGTCHALPDWYQARMPMPAEALTHFEAKIRSECAVTPTPWAIVSEAQKRFFKAAQESGGSPYLLEGFGRGRDVGNGRCYSGKKGRITYLDTLLMGHDGVFGIANCQVLALRRGGNGVVEAIDIALISRTTRRVLCERTLRVPPECRILMGAGSMGNHRILRASGDPLTHEAGGVLHQYTSEVCALFDDELPLGGVPQAIGMTLAPDVVHESGDVVRRILMEGGTPGRLILATLAQMSAPNRRQLIEKIGHLGVVAPVITESRPGTHMTTGQVDWTRQPLRPQDMERMVQGIEQIADVWIAAGAKGLSVNSAVPFQSRYQALRAIGFAAPEEKREFIQFLRERKPMMQVFYRTGNRFHALHNETGEVPGFKRTHLIGEDAIPPGPGVNPTLAIMMLAQFYADQM